MNPGILDRKIQLQRSSSSAGRFGDPTETWAHWKHRMAKRVEQSGKERSDNARERTQGAVTFRIRHTPGLKVTDRLVDTADGQAYDIEDFTGDPRQGYMEIHCTRHRTPENEGKALYPDAMVVEGPAGETSVLSVYPRSGDYEEKPAYVKSGSADKLQDGIIYRPPQDAPVANVWGIVGGDDIIYNSNQTTAETPDLAGAFGAGSGYSSPAPTVRYATWADIDAAGIDRSTVPLLP